MWIHIKTGEVRYASHEAGLQNTLRFGRRALNHARNTNALGLNCPTHHNPEFMTGKVGFPKGTLLCHQAEVTCREVG
jgi:hypothetical protein